MNQRQHSASRWSLLLETCLCLLVAVLAKRLVPFRHVSRILGRPVDAPEAPPIPVPLARDLGWAFGVVRRRWPIPPLCLTEVLALSMMLRRRKLRGASYLGVTSGQDTIQAHAWMRCGDRILPRLQDVEQYRIIRIFEPASPTPANSSSNEAPP